MSESSPEEHAKWVRETPSKHPLSKSSEKRGVFARVVTFLLSLALREVPLWGGRAAPLEPDSALASRPDLLEELDRLVLVDAVAAGALRR